MTAFRKIVLSSLLVSMTQIGCTKDSGKGETPPPVVVPPPIPEPPVPTPPPVITKMDVTPEEVAASTGCMSLPRLYDWLVKLPSDARIRKVTSDLRVVSGDGSGGVSGEPTERFKKFIASSSFEWTEFDPLGFVSSVPSTFQESCTTIEMRQADGSVGKFALDLAEPHKLVFENRGIKRTIELTSTRSLRQTFKHRAIDPCTQGKTHLMERTEVISWEDPATMSLKTETVEKSFISNVAEALETLPPAIESLVLKANQSPEPTIALGPEEANLLMTMPLKAEVLKCRDYSDEKSTPSPTPTPTQTDESVSA